jgi:hypothetical protein
VCQNGVEVHDYLYYWLPEPVDWVTPLKTYSNRQEGASASHGNEQPTLYGAYGHVCMIVRIGKAGDGLAYPTFAQVKKVIELL